MNIEETLRSIVQRKYRLLELRLEKYELVKGQASLLLLIKDNNGLAQNELSSLLGIKASSISMRLNKLEKLGYISRETDEKNLKRKRVYITTLGKTICSQCRRNIREINENMYHGFSKKDKASFESYLERIEKNLNR